jgi:probable F420-dependent oxidoreductase
VTEERIVRFAEVGFGAAMASSTRIGIMAPLGGSSTSDLRGDLRLAEELAYDDVWAGEVDDADAVSILAFAAAVTDRIGLGTAVLPVFTRGPAVLATTSATLARLAPGRVTIGVGASSPVIVEQWNGASFDEPLERTRDVVRFLRAALDGQRVVEDYVTFSIRGFRLASPPETPPRLLVAALRPKMLHVARDLADGAIVNWCGADDLPRLAGELGEGQELVVRLFVCPSADAEAVRAAARRQIAAYLTVPAYSAFQRWVGRAPALEAFWRQWAAGDRRAALAAVPDEVVDDLVVHGSPAECADHLTRFAANGATALAVSVLGGPVDPATALRNLAPELERMRSTAGRVTYDRGRISERTQLNAPVEMNETT